MTVCACLLLSTGAAVGEYSRVREKKRSLIGVHRKDRHHTGMNLIGCLRTNKVDVERLYTSLRLVG